MTLGHRHQRIAPRRGAAFVALFAVLFQAFLLAWHTHPLPFPQSGQRISVAAPNPASPLSPTTAGDDCPICVTLHHLSTAPIDFASPPALPRLICAVPVFGAAVVGGATTAAFRARAPPRA